MGFFMRGIRSSPLLVRHDDVGDHQVALALDLTHCQRVAALPVVRTDQMALPAKALGSGRFGSP